MQNSLHFLFTAANKNRKQAAKPAEDTPDTPVVPEGGYVIPEGAKTYTVEVDVAGYVDVASQYNVADLIAGCDTEATVQMAYLDANGELAWQDWTVTDGWFGVEGAHSWGAGCIACIKPNTDGSFGYVGAFSDLEVGASATAIFNYGNGVIVAITANVIASPSAPGIPDSDFVAPEADYVLDVQVVQDNGWGATYFALDGTDVTGWSKYEDAAAYVNPVAGVSVDITAEIEAALGIEIGTLKDEISAGTVYMGAYALDADGNVVFNDCYETKGSNYFYWFTETGYATSWGETAYVCIDNVGFVGDDVRLYGTSCMFPNRSVIGTTYSAYIVFKTEDAEYVVEVKATAVEAPEKQALPEMQIVKTYEETYSLVNPGAYADATISPRFTLETVMPDIVSMIEGEPDMLLMGLADGTFQEWTVTDGWFGADGASGWGKETQMFCLKPKADGTFSYCAAINDGECNAKCTYRYANSATLKAVDVVVTVALTAE